jgi:hypothetical protein
MGLLDKIADRLGYVRKYGEDKDAKFRYPSTIDAIEQEGLKFLKETDTLAKRTTTIKEEVDKISGMFLLAEAKKDVHIQKMAINAFYNLCATAIIPWLRAVDNPKLLKKVKMFYFKYNLNHDVPNAYNKLMIYCKYLMSFFTEVDVTIPRPVIIRSSANPQDHKETVIRLETGKEGLDNDKQRKL